MIAKIAQYVGGRLLTAVIVLGVGLTGFWFYRHPEHIEQLWRAARGGLLWIGFAAMLPWALFFLPRWVLKAESNVLAAGVLLAYLAADVLMALFLAGWDMGGSLSWAMLILGCLIAGFYNFLVCDFLAERFDDTV